MAIKFKAVKVNGDGVLVEGCVACVSGADRFRLGAAVQDFELCRLKPVTRVSVCDTNQVRR